MKKHEDIAKSTGNLFGGAEANEKHGRYSAHNPQHTTLLEFFLPIVILLCCVLTGVIYSGSAAIGLFMGGNITLVICTIFFVLRKRIQLKAIPTIYWQGIKLMFAAVLVLILAWSLGDLLREHLHTGEYLASLILNSLSINLLPMIMFFTATLIAFTIGTSWGTAAMIFPIVIPLVLSMTDAPLLPSLEQIPILLPVLGAVLSGCVAGNHISPIADTTIMSSMSTGAKLKDHICTQLQYAAPGILVTGIGFLISGYLFAYPAVVNIGISISIAVALNILVLCVLNKKSI